jgi:transcriptional activator SPT7
MQPPPFRPKLQTTFDNVPVLSRTPHSMVHYQSLSLKQPGPTFSDKGKAKEILHHHQAPSWYPPITAMDDESEDSKLEGAWWGFVAKDEAYTSSLPSVPTMLTHTESRPLRSRPVRARRRNTPPANGLGNHDSSATLVDEPTSLSAPLAKALSRNGHSPTPGLLQPKPVNLGTTIHRNVDKLFEIRNTVGQILDWQKAENEGLPLPVPKPHLEREERRQAKHERVDRKRRRKEERGEAKKRMKLGGEVGEEEAALSVRAATAGMLAQAGFDGQSLPYLSA